MTDYQRLQQVYKEIHQCNICPDMNPKKAERRIEAVDMKSDIFIISQSLAKDQLRRTGVNFFDGNGELGSTGKNLEKFFNSIGRTVYPPISVNLDSGKIIPKRKENLISVYNSEITQCFPGKREKGKGDRKPTAGEIHNCLTRGFLLKEIELLNPKIVMLMGAVSRNEFFRHFISATSATLSEHIAQIVKSGEIPEYSLGGHRFRILPIQHASGLNPLFQKMSNDPKLIKMIKEVLQ